MIPAGDLKHTLTVERQVGTLDALGQETDVWGVLARRRRARKQPLKDSERVAAAQQGATVTDRFLFRWEPRLIDLGAKDRMWLERPGAGPLLYAITAVKDAGEYRGGYPEGIEVTANAEPGATTTPATAPWLPSPGGTPEPGSGPAGKIITLPWVVDGGGVTIQPGIKGHLHLDFSAVVLGWTMLADAEGSTTVDIWRCTYAQFDPEASRPGPGDSITGGDPPRIIASDKAQSVGLVGWSPGLLRNDVLGFNVPASTHKRVTLGLRLQKVE